MDNRANRARSEHLKSSKLRNLVQLRKCWVIPFRRPKMLNFRAYPTSCYPCPTYEDLPKTSRSALRYHRERNLVPSKCPWCEGALIESEKKYGIRLQCNNKAEHIANGFPHKIYYNQGRPEWMKDLRFEPWELERMLWLRHNKIALNVICDVIPSLKHLDKESRKNRMTVFNERFRNL